MMADASCFALKMSAHLFRVKRDQAKEHLADAAAELRLPQHCSQKSLGSDILARLVKPGQNPLIVKPITQCA